MKTDVYRFERAVDNIDEIVGLAEKIAAYNDLSENEELKLSLLCEELVELLPNLLIYGKGEFWIENNGKNYEVHAVVEADDLLTSSDRKEILAVSRSKKNSAAVGIMNRIKLAAEELIANYALSKGVSGEVSYDTSSLEALDYDYADPFAQQDMWSLVKYKKTVQDGTDAWDELEKSIIANLADDVTVGIIGGKVEVVIKKTF